MELDHLCLLLEEALDVEGWWPSDGPFEVMVGALLTQQTTWEKVVPVLEDLRSRGLLSPLPLSLFPYQELQSIVRPTGFYRQKAERLLLLSRHLVQRHGGDPLRLLNGELRSCRHELLSLKGVGPETADSILLFAGGRPKFVAAGYAVRIFHRTGVLHNGDYDSVQGLVESRYPDDAGRYRRLYAMLIELAKTHCRSVPRCAGCPLREECPSNPHEIEQQVAHKQ